MTQKLAIAGLSPCFNNGSSLHSQRANCREARKKERLEGEVKQLKSALEARQADIKTKSAAAQQSEEQVKRLEQMLRESQVMSQTALLVPLLAKCKVESCCILL